MIEINGLVSAPSLCSGRFCDDVHILSLYLLAMCVDAHGSSTIGNH